MSIKAISWAIEVNGIKPGAKLVLMLLADAHNGQSGECFPMQDLIAERSGMGLSTVKDHIKALETEGFIERDTTKLGRGKGSRTSYKLHIGKIDSRNLDVLNSDFTQPKNTPLDSRNSALSYKEEPELTGKEPEVGLKGFIEIVWEFSPRKSRERSSRKKLEAAFTKAAKSMPKNRTDISCPQLIAGSGMAAMMLGLKAKQTRRPKSRINQAR